MASSASRVLRSLAKELGRVYRKEKLQDVPAYAYLHEQMKNFEVTDEKICRAHNEVQHVAETYLCYLESLRKQEELSQQYKGRGERSVESSAEIVGLKLPKLFSEDAPADKPDP
ncbi:protein FMC1 homolog [Aplysia californica]|uniref:Protein FMC1 homolog n=1 Tax=Aplysia californica TaxID=6500 RepID=A0ABM0JN61_APLCA|nr:protein FMC1 homolog [Aplysia californica]